MIQRIQNTPQRQKFGMKTDLKTGAATVSAIKQNKIGPVEAWATENMLKTVLSDHLGIIMTPLEDNFKTVALSLVNLDTIKFHPILLVQKNQPSSLTEMAGVIFNNPDYHYVIKKNVDLMDRNRIEVITARIISPAPDFDLRQNTAKKIDSFLNQGNIFYLGYENQNNLSKIMKQHLAKSIKKGTSWINGINQHIKAINTNSKGAIKIQKEFFHVLKIE